jgi:hypothetical protein
MKRTCHRASFKVNEDFGNLNSKIQCFFIIKNSKHLFKRTQNPQNIYLPFLRLEFEIVFSNH